MFQVPSMKRLTVRGRLALLTGVAISTMLALPLADLAVGRPIDVISLCVAGVGALIVAALTRSMGRAVLPALAGITDAMTRLSNDEYGVKIPATKREDEIGEAARAIKTYTSSGTQMAWVESAVDSISRNVMIVAPDCKIVYLNKSVRTLLKAVQADIRKDLPQFDAGKLSGQSMFFLHKDPDRQRSRLEKLVSVSRTQHSVGGHDFEFVVTPMMSKETRVGFVVELADITEQQAVQSEVTRIVEAAMVGDFTLRIDVEGKHGFMQDLSEGINRLADTMAVALDEVSAMMAAMANGDLSKRVAGDYQGGLLRLKTDANATAQKLAQVVGQTMAGMANIKASTTEIASGASDLSSRTENQVASLEEVSASIRELSDTVQHSAENAGQANQLVLAARTSAESGGQVVNTAVSAMGEIEQSARRISDIVGMIDEIAFQTNLLALNAAVEAARAGEAGRGFAVVAGEVRALAQRSSQASKEIKTLIANSNMQVKHGVELVNKAGGALGEIVTSVKRVSDIVAEIAAANKEQSASVGEVQQAIGQIEQATQQNAALVEETTAALSSVDSQVGEVSDVISFFRSAGAVVAKLPNRAPAKGAKAVQSKLTTRLVAKPNIGAVATSGGKRPAAGSSDGWEEF
jgi:methyl-accepting chemotaxis protein